MRYLTGIALATAALGIACWAADPPASQPASKSASQPAGDGRLEGGIGLLSDKDLYQSGDAVNVRFTVKNVSKGPLAIWSRDCSWGHEVYFFEIVTADGVKVSLQEPARQWLRNGRIPKELAPGETFSANFDLTKLEGWKPVAATIQIRGVYQARNEFKGDPDRPKLQTLWEGRLVTEPVKVTFPGKA
jgi:hypothetical protein